VSRVGAIAYTVRDAPAPRHVSMCTRQTYNRDCRAVTTYSNVADGRTVPWRGRLTTTEMGIAEPRLGVPLSDVDSQPLE
jgi:hypothetical protein